MVLWVLVAVFGAVLMVVGSLYMVRANLRGAIDGLELAVTLVAYGVVALLAVVAAIRGISLDEETLMVLVIAVVETWRRRRRHRQHSAPSPRRADG